MDGFQGLGVGRGSDRKGGAGQFSQVTVPYSVVVVTYMTMYFS